MGGSTLSRLSREVTECVHAAISNRTARKVIIVASLLIASAATAARITVYHLKHPPMLIRDAYLDETVVPMGGSLTLVLQNVNMSEDNSCAGYIIREISREITLRNGKRVILKKRALLPPPPAGTAGEYAIDVPLLPNTKLGHWSFKGETVRDCGTWLGGVDKYQTVDLEFDVVTPEDYEAWKSKQ